MAKDDINLDFEEFDDLGIGMVPLDGDTADDKDLGSRNPILKTGKSFLKGLKKTVISPTTLGRVIDRVLPESYKELRLKGSNVVKTFGEIKDDVKKEIKPEIKKVKKIIDKALPMGEKYIPEGIKERLQEFSKDTDGDSTYRESSKIDANELLIKNSLNDIFNKQEQLNQKKDTLEKVEMIYKEKKADLRTKATLSVQSATHNLLSRLVSYQDRITSNYQKQSLELQFRHYFVARDLFTISQASFKDISEELKGIKQNTGLPDVQKIRLSETWKQGLMQQIWGVKGESAGEFANKYWEKAKGNLINKVKEKIGFIKDPVSMILDSIGDYQEMQETMGEMGEKTSAAESAGGFVGNKLVDKLIKPLRSKLTEQLFIQKGDVAARYLNENPIELLEDLSSRNYDNPVLNWISDQFRDILPSRKEEGNIEKRYKTTGLEAIPFDVSTRRSIVEIIPGFLSRIHQGIMNLVTGNKNYSRLVFDSSSESFKSIKEMGEEVKKKIVDDSTKTQLEGIFDDFYKKLDKDNKLSDKEKKLISKRLLEDADKGVTLFDPRKLTNENWYKQDIDEETLNKIKEVIETNYKFTKTGGLDITDKNLLSSSRSIRDLSNVIPNFQELINTYQNFGEMDAFRESGFISSNTYGEKFSHSKLWDSLLDLNAEGNEKEGDYEKVENEEIRKEKKEEKGKEKRKRKMGQREDIRLSSIPIKEAIDKTNRILTDIKTLNENCCNSFLEKDFLTKDSEFKNAKEIFLNINQSLLDIKEKEAGGSSTVSSNDSDFVKEEFFNKNVLNYLEAITEGVWANVKATSLIGSIATTNDIGGRTGDLIKKSMSRVLSGGEKSLKGIGSVLKNTGAGLGSMVGSIGGMGKHLGRMTGIKDAVGKRLGRMTGIKDIYVNGDEEPRLLARKIRKGHYYNLSTNTPVHEIDDITGIVVDVDNNNEVIITEEDFHLGFYTYNADGTIRKTATKIWGLTKGTFSSYGIMTKGVYGLAKKGLGVTKQIYREIKGVKDIYVAGETTPRLLGIVLRRGGYLSAKTGKPIYSLKDIDGIIVDSTGKVILALEDLANLYDQNNRKIDIRSLSEKLLGGVGKGLRHLTTKSLGVAKWSTQATLKGVKGGISKTKNIINKSIESLTKKMGYTPSKKEEIPHDVIISYESVNILNKIYSLLFKRLPKRKNIRKGSWQEQFMEDKKEEENEEGMENQQKMEKRGAMSKLINKLKIGKRHNATEEDEGIISKIVDYGIMAGTITAAGAAFGAGSTALTSAITATSGALASGGMAGVTGLIGSTVLAPLAIAGGVALAGYGLYKGAKYLLNRKDPEQLEKLRMMQYGASEDENEKIAILRQFEEVMVNKINLISGIIRLTDSPADIFKEVYDLFDLDPNNKDTTLAWGTWYTKRFEPIFLRNMEYIITRKIDDFEELEELKEDQKVSYVKNVTVDYLKRCYCVVATPFGEGPITVEPVQIEKYTKELLDSLDKTQSQKISTDIDNIKEATTYTELDTQMEKEDVEEEKGFFSTVMTNISEFFSEKKLVWNNEKIGIIEKYRLLQYGVNPNDDYQVQPIRAFEKYCLEEYNYEIEKLTKIRSYFLLQKVIEYFPFELNNKPLVKKWQNWFENRFLPIYVKYIKFMEKEKIKDFFDLEEIVTNRKLSALVNLVDVENNDKRSYEIISTPFGDHYSSVTIELIKQYKDYLLSLQKQETITLGKFSNIKESLKTYTEYKEQKRETMDEQTKQILSNKNLSTVNKERSKFEVAVNDETENIELIPPVNVKPNSNFGVRKDPFGNSVSFHKGIDYAAPEGTPIAAAASGKMIRKDKSSSYGNVIYLKHNDGLVTKYAHMSGFNNEYNKGDMVNAGDIIGYIGSTGRSTGSHLHFELRKGTSPKDPAYDPISYMRNGDLLASNDSDIGEDKQAGGINEPIKETNVSEKIMEDYNEVLTKKDEVLQQRRTKAIEAQRQLENKQYLQRLSTIDSTLRESLKVQITMSEYLQLIHESINNYEIVTGSDNEKAKKDETLSLKLPNNESVAPLVSMRRRKSNG